MIRIHIESENADIAGEEMAAPIVNQVITELTKQAKNTNKHYPDFFKKRPYVVLSVEDDLIFNSAARSVSELTTEFQGFVHQCSSHADHKCIINKDAALVMATPLLDLFSIRLSVLERLTLKKDRCHKEPKDSAIALFGELKKLSIKRSNS